MLLGGKEGKSDLLKAVNDQDYTYAMQILEGLPTWSIKQSQQYVERGIKSLSNELASGAQYLN